MVQNEKSITISDKSFSPYLLAPDIRLQNLKLFESSELKIFEKLGEGM